NYGCPVKGVACRGAGAGLLRDIPKMVAMTAEIVKIANRPVTVKTRLGWDHDSLNIVEVAERLQDIGISALSIHGRTRAQLYKGPADWTLIGKVKENPRIQIPIFGNGDVDSPEKAMDMKNRYGVDGLMIGRASIGYPWIFNEIKHYLRTGTKAPLPDNTTRVSTCRKHFERSMEWKGPITGIHEMRRHYASYFKGYDNFKEIRTRLVTTYDPQEIHALLDLIQERYSNGIEV
ncbi:MAG: tRNA dihydrouridine synthase, partial [Bacteroidota bacterium]